MPRPHAPARPPCAQPAGAVAADVLSGEILDALPKPSSPTAVGGQFAALLVHTESTLAGQTVATRNSALRRLGADVPISAGGACVKPEPDEGEGEEEPLEARHGCVKMTMFSAVKQPAKGPCSLVFDLVARGKQDFEAFLRTHVVQWLKAAAISRERHRRVADNLLVLHPGTDKPLADSRHSSTQRIHGLTTCAHLVTHYGPRTDAWLSAVNVAAWQCRASLLSGGGSIGSARRNPTFALAHPVRRAPIATRSLALCRRSLSSHPLRPTRPPRRPRRPRRAKQSSVPSSRARSRYPALHI